MCKNALFLLQNRKNRRTLRLRPQTPLPPAAEDFAPTSDGWGLCSQIPIGLWRLVAPPPDPRNSPPMTNSRLVTIVNIFSLFSLQYFLEFHHSGLGLGPHLFVKVPRLGDNERTFSVFESSCHLLYYQSNHSRVRGNPIKCLAQRHNKRTCRPVSTLTLLNA